MSRCEQCGEELKKAPLPLSEHVELVGGIRVVLHNCVDEFRCPNHHDVCATEIPDQEGLEAAVAVERINRPEKLTGKEIRFLRRTLDWSAKDLAAAINASDEAVSRWENDKMPIGPTSERLLRMVIGLAIKEEGADRAPGINFDALEIAALHIQPVRDSRKPLELWFVRAPILREKPRKRENAWMEQEAVNG